jgi:hypothetical protein
VNPLPIPDLWHTARTRAFRVTSWSWFARREAFQRYRAPELTGQRIVRLLEIQSVRDRYWCRPLLGAGSVFGARVK